MFKNNCIALQFDRRIGSTAAGAPVKFQSDRVIPVHDKTIANVDLILHKVWNKIKWLIRFNNWHLIIGLRLTGLLQDT